MNVNTGGPAFPSPNAVTVGQYVSSGHSGMTLRDYFAAKAMQGLLAGKLATTKMSVIAGECYSMADAMLKAREA